MASPPKGREKQMGQAAGYCINGDVTVLLGVILVCNAAGPSKLARLMTSASDKTIPANFQKENASLLLLAQIIHVRNIATGNSDNFINKILTNKQEIFGHILAQVPNCVRDSHESWVWE